MESYFQKVYELVSHIPKGKVTTYGQIALLIGDSKNARVVGWAMKAAPKELKLPCHRVLKKTGELAPEHAFGDKNLQKILLEGEGITFLKNDCVDMKKHFWLGL